MRPTKRNIQKLIHVLLSETYPQTKGRMNRSDGYCVLGVACKTFMDKKNLKLDDAGRIFGYDPKDQPKAPKWLKNLNSDFEIKTGVCLSELNDSLDFSFFDFAQVLDLVYLQSRTLELN